MKQRFVCTMLLCNQWLYYHTLFVQIPTKPSWAEWMHLMEFTYNSTLHSSTGYTPFQLLYGFKPKKASDFLSWTHGECTIQSTAQEFLDEIELHCQITHQSIIQAQGKQAVAYNRNYKSCKYQLGDQVLVNPHELHRMVRRKRERSQTHPTLDDGVYQP